MLKKKNCEMSYPLLSMTFKTFKTILKKTEKKILKKKKTILETCLKNIVFCLILTELFLLKYIHKHSAELLVLFGVFSVC